MKVLHINCNYIGTTLHQLMVRKLTDLGIESQVYVPTYNKNLSIIECDPNVIVAECFRKWDRVAFDYKQSKILCDLQKRVDTAKFDCIHAYTLFTDGNCARNLFHKYGVPYVVAVRNTDVNCFLKLMPHLRHRGVEIMLDAKAVFFLSDSYRKQVFDKYIPVKYRDRIAKKAHVIPNGIDDFWFQNIPEQKKNTDLSKSIKLVYAGKIDKNKNITATQKAMDILRNGGIRTFLTVVGKVSDQSEFQKICKDAYTTYCPAMPKEELIQVYRQHDIFVMPSHTESFGLVYAEAISQGLPVIYTRGQGFDGQFPDGLVGYAVDDDPKSIAEGIVKTVQHWDDFRALPTKANTFHWSEIVKKYVEIYDNRC